MTRIAPARAPDPEVLAVARQVAGIVRRITGDAAYRVVLFGSWGSGQAGARSDIDLGIDGPAPVPADAMFEIREACDALPTLFTLDLVDLSRVPPGSRRGLTSCPIEADPA